MNAHLRWRAFFGSLAVAFLVAGLSFIAITIAARQTRVRVLEQTLKRNRAVFLQACQGGETKVGQIGEMTFFSTSMESQRSLGFAEVIDFQSERKRGRALLAFSQEPGCEVLRAEWNIDPKLRRLFFGWPFIVLPFAAMIAYLLVRFFILGPHLHSVASLLRLAEGVGNPDLPLSEDNVSPELHGIQASLLSADARIREAQRSLTREISAKEGFLSNVAHDLRSPITALQLTLEELSEEEMKPDAESLVCAAIEHTIYAASLISNLQWVSRLGSSWDPMTDATSVDLRELLFRVVERERIAARWKQVTIDIDFKNAIHTALPPTLAEQVFTNLIQNAVRHGKEGGKVEVVGSSSKDMFKVAVIDDGGGDASRIQTLLSTSISHGRSRHQTRGNQGLGLQIVAQASSRLNWKISVCESDLGGVRVLVEGYIVERG